MITRAPSFFQNEKGKPYAVKVFDDLGRTMPEIEQEHYVFTNHAVHPNLPTFFGMYKFPGNALIRTFDTI